LDAGGLQEVNILASGSLDEFALARLLKEGAPIDGFGIGSRLDTSADAPYLDSVYKLQEYAGRPRRKRSEGKATWPGSKQLFRRYHPGGRMAEDLLSLEGDPQEGEPLIVPVMRAGRRLASLPTLTEARQHAAAGLARLPKSLRQLEAAPHYPVKISPSLLRLTEEVDQGGARS
jgi:nicotinate phosphoribosyltransferase